MSALTKSKVVELLVSPVAIEVLTNMVGYMVTMVRMWSEEVVDSMEVDSHKRVVADSVVTVLILKRRVSR